MKGQIKVNKTLPTSCCRTLKQYSSTSNNQKTHCVRLLMPIPLSETWHACLPIPAHITCCKPIQRTSEPIIQWIWDIHETVCLRQMYSYNRYGLSLRKSVLIMCVGLISVIVHASYLMSFLLVLPPPPMPPPPALPKWRRPNFRPQSLLLKLRLPHLVQRDLFLLRVLKKMTLIKLSPNVVVKT